MLVSLLAVSSAQAAGLPRSQRPPRPSLNALIGQYLARRPGAVTAAIYDVNTGQSLSYNGGMRNYTASIIKVDILETRLHQTGGQLSGHERRLAAAMIEQSDNNAATALWNEDGGAVGVGAYNTQVGLRCTSFDPYGQWGLTLTCASDQLRLLAELVSPNPSLSDYSRHYQLHLMKHVVSWEAWGVSGGVPHTGVSVALKNGWLPHGNVPWIVNSIGVIHGDGRYYFIAVLTRDPTQADGIDTIEGISGIVWQHIS